MLSLSAIVVTQIGNALWHFESKRRSAGDPEESRTDYYRGLITAVLLLSNFAACVMLVFVAFRKYFTKKRKRKPHEVLAQTYLSVRAAVTMYRFFMRVDGSDRFQTPRRRKRAAVDLSGGGRRPFAATRAKRAHRKELHRRASHRRTMQLMRAGTSSRTRAAAAAASSGGTSNGLSVRNKKVVVVRQRAPQARHRAGGMPHRRSGARPATRVQERDPSVAVAVGNKVNGAQQTGGVD